MAVRVTVCGPLTVHRDGRSWRGPELGTRKARLLVAVLTAARGAAVPTDRLAAALWAGQPPRDPEGNLATLVSRLRKAVGDTFVVLRGGSYALEPGAEVDLDVVAELLAGADARLRRAEPTLAVASASRALELLGGDDALAEEFDQDPEATEDWAAELRRECAELRRNARHLLCTAALGTGQPDLAHRAALAATAADPYDERAHRDLMTALVRDGRPSAALAVYTDLAQRLADELGTDPDPETRGVQLAILRAEPGQRAPLTRATPTRGFALVGRDTELALLDRAWAEASHGHPALLLIAGAPGVGKTRLLAELADLARSSGGLVLSARCRPQERSLFLQPFLEVLRPVLLVLPRTSLELLLGGHLPAWIRLLPELRELFDVPEPADTSPELARRRAFDAITAAIVGLAARRPVLLEVDDLQYGANVTAALLGQLGAGIGNDGMPGTPGIETDGVPGTLGASGPPENDGMPGADGRPGMPGADGRPGMPGAALLAVAASRTDGLPALRDLVAGSPPMMLGPLPPSAVQTLADAAGLAPQAEEIHARTRGHPLSVVASLTALREGTSGPPADLATTVTGQLDRLAPGTAGLARAASVLGTAVEPLLLAGLAGQPEVTVVLGCEQLVTAGLMAAAGTGYEFANDLVAEAVRASLPPALAIGYHRRAADLLADRPERMAGHAHEAGEFARAASGYLQAGRAARLNGGLEDASTLLDLALGDARAAQDDALITSALLERARAHEAGADYRAAESDVIAADATAPKTGELRLRMRAQYVRGGDISIARGRPVQEVVDVNRAGYALAAELGDAVSQSLFRTRIVVLETSRLRLADALRIATDGLAQARATGVGEAVARSLDGVKSALAHTGDVAALAPVLDELIPMLTERRLAWLLQWALLESALVPAASNDWTRAHALVDEAIEVNRRTGYGAYTGFFLAQRAYLARVAGDLDAALADGRAAVAATSPTAHPWWHAAAAGIHASTLLELGRPDEAAELSAAGLAELGDEVGAGYRLRCLAPLAAVTGQQLDQADRLVTGIQSPPGQAWIAGADVYQALATAWLAAGEPERASAVLTPLLDATRSSWPAVHRRALQRISATSVAARSAPSAGTGR